MRLTCFIQASSGVINLHLDVLTEGIQSTSHWSFSFFSPSSSSHFSPLPLPPSLSFWDNSHCSPGLPWTISPGHPWIYSDPPAFASHVLELQARTTTTSFLLLLIIKYHLTFSPQWPVTAFKFVSHSIKGKILRITVIFMLWSAVLWTEGSLIYYYCFCVYFHKIILLNSGLFQVSKISFQQALWPGLEPTCWSRAL